LNAQCMSIIVLWKMILYWFIGIAHFQFNAPSWLDNQFEIL
jgi:hypothetical protein